MSTGKPVALRVVLDTNVFVSAFTHPGGLHAALWEIARGGSVSLIVSPPIIGELAEVLRLKFRWKEESITQTLKHVTRAADIVLPAVRVRSVPADPDDDRIIECAVAGHADLIVSGDKHLLRLKRYGEIAIISPRQFYRMLTPARLPSPSR